MIDLADEAKALQDAIRVRNDLRLRLDDLIALQGKLDGLGPSLMIAEREARKIGLRQSVVGSTTNPRDLDTAVEMQTEANAAFQSLSGSLSMMSDQIAMVRTLISEWDKFITNMELAFCGAITD